MSHFKPLFRPIFVHWLKSSFAINIIYKKSFVSRQKAIKNNHSSCRHSTRPWKLENLISYVHHHRYVCSQHIFPHNFQTVSPQLLPTTTTSTTALLSHIVYYYFVHISIRFFIAAYSTCWPICCVCESPINYWSKGASILSMTIALAATDWRYLGHRL